MVDPNAPTANSTVATIRPGVRSHGSVRRAVRSSTTAIGTLMLHTVCSASTMLGQPRPFVTPRR
jgi:hypothetical protein